MIELIFAIIVIAIAIGGIPAVVQQVEDSTDLSINQEAIWMASSVIYNILDHQWDENSYNNGVDKAIAVSNSGDTDLNRVGISPREFERIGHIKGNNRRSFFRTQTDYDGLQASTTLGDDGETNVLQYNDIDDFNGYNGLLSQAANFRNTLRYKKNYNMSIGVKYINDSLFAGDYTDSQVVTFQLNPTSVTGSTNIKYIELNVTDCGNGELAFRLQAFSSNIGEYVDLTNRVH